MTSAHSSALGAMPRFLGCTEGYAVGAIVAYFAEFLSHPPPQVLLLHLGENDLCQRTCLFLRQQVNRDIKVIWHWIPEVVILWSSLLPCLEAGCLSPSGRLG